LGEEKTMKKKHPLRHVVAALGWATLAPLAHATEGNGLGLYPDGLENFMAGALPPPGVYGMVYAGGAHYDRLRGNDGTHIGPPDFKVKVTAVVPRLIWVTPVQVLGGSLAFEALAPVLKVDVTAGGQHFSKSGVGDLIFGPALGFHHSPSLHSVLALDVYAPTAQYDRNNPASLGKNIWVYQPIAAVTYLQPTGLNADLKAMVDINGRNGDTQTRSGQALHGDVAVGWGLGNGWVIGGAGHFYRQVTDDSGPNAGTGKASAVGFGPSIRYADGKGLLVTAKLQKEFAVRNRPEGSALWVKATIPF
jgi:hypothetical protein